MKKEILFAVADCETDPFKKGRIPAPFIWGFYDGCDYLEFVTTKQFVDYVSQREMVLYAHNGGKFDWHFLLDYLDEFSDMMIIAGRIAKFKIGKCEFRDSYNILPVPLAAYKKDEIDYAIFEPDKRTIPKNMRAIKDYLRMDCVYLYQLVHEFVSAYGMALTVAGAAMKQWQKITKQKTPKTSQSFYDGIKPYYYGGRVECFKQGVFKTKFKVIDINSAYPYAMKHLHPYGTIASDSDELPKTRAYIERSMITLFGVCRGAFPFPDKTGLKFPTDDTPREYNVTGWEYLAALDTGALGDHKIRRVLTFNDSIRFDGYVDHFYAMKNESEKGSPAYIFAKLFLNSLYGKFGANPDNYREHIIVSPAHIAIAENDDYEHCAFIGPWSLCAKPLDEVKQHYYNVATAASITGFVRAMLWRAISQCKGVMYCDTDSIACQDTGKLKLHPTDLGAWDVEAECDMAAIAGKKLYAFKISHGDKKGQYKKASKGVRLEAGDIIKVAQGKNVVYDPIAPSFSVKRGIQFVPRKIEMKC